MEREEWLKICAYKIYELRLRYEVPGTAEIDWQLAQFFLPGKRVWVYSDGSEKWNWEKEDDQRIENLNLVLKRSS